MDTLFAYTYVRNYPILSATVGHNAYTYMHLSGSKKFVDIISACNSLATLALRMYNYIMYVYCIPYPIIYKAYFYVQFHNKNYENHLMSHLQSMQYLQR